MSASQPRLIFVLAGQSNMAGRGALDEAAAVPPDPRGVVFSPVDDKEVWHPATDPLHPDTNGRKAGVGPGMAFAHELLRLAPRIAPSIGLVPCAYGGSELARWEEGGDLFAAAVARVRRCMAEGDATAVIAGVLWHQGESDGTSAYDTYLGAWTAMYNGWLTDFPNVEGVYVMQVRSGCGGPTWNRNVQRDLPDLLDKVSGHMSTTGVAGHDGCHFYNQTYVEWGERIEPCEALKGSPPLRCSTVASERRLECGEALRSAADLQCLSRPYNSETRRDVLSESYLTPTDALYVRNHAPVPALDGVSHRLSFSEGDEEVRL